MVVPDPEELKEQKRLGKEFRMQTWNNKNQQKYDLLEKKLKVLKYINILGRVDTAELSLVLDLVIPPKFKI